MKYGRLITLALTTVWLLTSWYSLAYMNSANVSMDGNCPLMSHETMFCPMTVAQHIDRWTNDFLSINPLLLLLGALLIIHQATKWVSALRPTIQLRQRWRQLNWGPPLASFIHRGLLQPKLYS